MMKYDSQKFFKAYRKHFRRVSQTQVIALEKLLGAIAEYDLSVPELAYILATIHHETAATYEPIREYGRGKGKKYGIPAKNGEVYFGRGFVQLTWDYNYEKADRELRERFPNIVNEYENRTNKRFDLVEDADQALDFDVAFAVMIAGMKEGWFTGKKLSQYFTKTKKDYLNARKIINGMDKAELIAGYARDFETILTESEQEAINPTVASETTDTTTQSTPTADTPAQTQVSLFTKIGAGVTALTGLGINAGTMVQTKIDQMTPQQVLYLALALAVVLAAIWWYKTSSDKAHKERMK